MLITLYKMTLAKPLIGFNTEGLLFTAPRGATVYVTQPTCINGDIGVEDCEEVDSIVKEMVGNNAVCE